MLLSWNLRSGILIAKFLSGLAGAIAILFALAYINNEYTYLGNSIDFRFSDIILVASIVGVVLSGIALLASLPNSIRVKFEKLRITSKPKPVYGFVTMLAVGLGATLGSPLFILIPLNIMQYEFVSLGSLMLAAILSILLAKVYGDMYRDSSRLGADSLGGPSFTRAATGRHSVRYFISRLSMWIANTALAAYSKIVFVLFDFELMPSILKNMGIHPAESQFIVYMITAVFLAWTVLNALYEQKLLKMIGYIQIVMTTIMVFVLVYQSVLLGYVGSWDISGIASFTGGGNWILALIVNTGYLYLLFFGFQEIQALEHDALPESGVPIISWIKKGYAATKSQYLGYAMIGSVVIAAFVNILYGLAVFSLHPSYSTISSASIPALYITGSFLGPTQEMLTAIAFLLATITTFVPSFLAASRHLEALSSDGFIPPSMGRLSFVFTLGAILILALGDQNFLIEITDFLVLISLGVISLSAVWLRKRSLGTLRRNDALPIAVSISCFAAGATIYLISSSVAVFGAVSIAVAYLIFVVYELGYLGSQLFLGVFDLTACLFLVAYPKSFPIQSFFLFNLLHLATPSSDTLALLLVACASFLFANVLMDIGIRREQKRLLVEKI